MCNRYFHRGASSVWDDAEGDYADPDYIPEHPSYEWDWTVSDIVNALIQAGLTLEFVHEYEKLFFRFFPSMTSEDGRWFRLPGGKAVAVTDASCAQACVERAFCRLVIYARRPCPE